MPPFLPRVPRLQGRNDRGLRNRRAVPITSGGPHRFTLRTAESMQVVSWTENLPSRPLARYDEQAVIPGRSAERARTRDFKRLGSCPPAFPPCAISRPAPPPSPDCTHGQRAGTSRRRSDMPHRFPRRGICLSSRTRLDRVRNVRNHHTKAAARRSTFAVSFRMS